MDKILIVGHPQSGHHDIEQILLAAGMAQARPSRREGLMPGPLDALLCRVHDVPLADSADDVAALPQTAVSPVWHGLALDLMLANVDQRLWGWSDPAAVQLLQFWHDIDPDIHFVMVYDTPAALLASVCQTCDPQHEDAPLEDVLARHMRQWMRYHTALLQFYLRHTQRCLLVQRQRGRQAPGELLARLQDRTVAPWAAQPGAAEPVTTPTSLTDWMAGALAEHFPAARQLYEEMQLSASLPHGASPGADLADLWHVWNERMAQVRSDQRQRQTIGAQQAQIGQLQGHLQTASADQQRLRQLEHIASLRQQRIQRLALQTSGQQQAIEQSQARTARQAALLRQLRHQRQQEHLDWQAQRRQVERHAHDQQRTLDQARCRADEQTREIAGLTQRLRAADQDHALLLSQLQQVQEALGHQHANQKSLAAQLAQLQQVEQLAATRQHRIDSLDQQLTARQQELALAQAHAAEQVQAQAALTQALRTQEQAGERLMAQLQQVQETLARQHTHQQQLTQRLEAIPRLEQQVRERTARVEQLDREVIAQRHTITQAEAHAGSLQTRLQDQATAHQSLIEDHARLVAQLQHVQQVLALQHQAAAAPQTPTPTPTPTPTGNPPPAAPFGAADRVKAQLSYRLGATLIQHSQSLSGWLRMPFAIWSTVTQFQREQPQRQAHKLPPIHQYRDAHEAERVRRHLSYRLGTVLVQNARSPLGWGRMPFAMQREIRAFRSGQGA
jgi:hypothetical protein